MKYQNYASASAAETLGAGRAPFIPRDVVNAVPDGAPAYIGAADMLLANQAAARRALELSSVTDNIAAEVQHQVGQRLKAEQPPSVPKSFAREPIERWIESQERAEEPKSRALSGTLGLESLSYSKQKETLEHKLFRLEGQVQLIPVLQRRIQQQEGQIMRLELQIQKLAALLPAQLQAALTAEPA